MKLLLFSIFDKKADAFTQPMFFRSKGEAIRSFMDAVGTAETPFCKHPEDYSFCHVGDFDDSTGAVTGMNAGPVFVMQALECVRKPD